MYKSAIEYVEIKNKNYSNMTYFKYFEHKMMLQSCSNHKIVAIEFMILIKLSKANIQYIDNYEVSI